jgi:hypothetical protein
MRKLIDNIDEEQVIANLISQARQEGASDDRIIRDRNKRIAEIDRSLADPSIRDSMKRDLRTHRQAYRNEIIEIIRKNNVYNNLV